MYICTQSGVHTDGLRFLVNSGNQAFFGLNSSDSTGATISQVYTSALSSGWHHLAGVYDGYAKTIAIYVDGSLSSSASLPGGFTPWQATGHFLIGAGFGGAAPWNGNLDELKTFNRALTAAEVLSLHAYIPGTSLKWDNMNDGLTHYFAFNEAGAGVFGSMVFDSCHTSLKTYDADNRVIASTDGRGDITGYTYDGGAGSDPRSGSPFSSRTQKGLLSSTSDGNGHVTKFGYSVRNETEAIAYADSTAEYMGYYSGSTFHTGYDANGNRTYHTDANGNTTQYVYDNANRLTNVDYDTSLNSSWLDVTSTSNVTFGYDGANRQTSMVDGTGTTNWTYDNDNRAYNIQSPQLGSGSGTSHGLYYTFDPGGRHTGTTLNGSTTWSYGYDYGNRLTTVTSPYGIGSEYNTSISYNQDNTRDTLTAQNGAVTTYTYDVNARPTHISTANTSMTVLQASSYYYDNAGNVMIKPIFGGGTGTPNIYYQYDGADELTMESMLTTSTAYPNAYTYRYAYDHNANRLNKETIVLGGSPSDTVASYTYDSHDKMTASGPYTFTYDANGNMTGVSSGGTANWSYTYDCENRMLVASDLAGAGSGGSDSNTYNGVGCRVANHDFAGNYSNMTDGVGPTSPVLYNGVEKFTPGFSSEDLTGSGTSYYTEPDQIGTSLGMMSTSETQIYGVEYDAFGDIIGTSGAFPDSYAFMDGYAGQGGYQTDRDTGFIRCGNRFYSPFFGRFITQDPAGSGTNWYAYCGNDPTGETDPSGMDSMWEALDQNTGSPGNTAQNAHGGPAGVAYAQQQVDSSTGALEYYAGPTTAQGATVIYNPDGSVYGTITTTYSDQGTDQEGDSVLWQTSTMVLANSSDTEWWNGESWDSNAQVGTDAMSGTLQQGAELAGWGAALTRTGVPEFAEAGNTLIWVGAAEAGFGQMLQNNFSEDIGGYMNQMNNSPPAIILVPSSK